MPNYKKMYFALFNSVTTAINQLQNAQQEGENAYIESSDVSLTALPNHIAEKAGERDASRQASSVDGKD